MSDGAADSAVDSAAAAAFLDATWAFHLETTSFTGGGFFSVLISLEMLIALAEGEDSSQNTLDLKFSTVLPSPHLLGALRVHHQPSPTMIFKRFSHSLTSIYCQTMTGLANPATVITTGGISSARGLTVSSLSSVSVRPQPIIAFNLQIPSHTASALHNNGRFAVNFLPATSEAAALCRAMAGQKGRDINPFELHRHMFEEKNGLTVVKDAFAILYCEKNQVFTVQDHEIWTGVVDRIERPTSISSAGPLLYQHHKFHHLGIEVEENDRQ